MTVNCRLEQLFEWNFSPMVYAEPRDLFRSSTLHGSWNRAVRDSPHHMVRERLEAEK